MALDMALMDRARRTGESVLRVYAWSSPVLSLGRNQRARDAYDMAAIERHGLGVVRRPTGGRALLHHREVTYSVTAPVQPERSLGETYHQVNTLVLEALETMGVHASIAQPLSPALAPSAVPCFAEPAAGEIVVDGKKLVGSAQWRDDGALLQHGSIIVCDDQPLIPLVMRDAPPPSPTPATLHAILGRTPETAEVAAALFDALRRSFDSSARPLTDDEVRSLGVDTHVARFRDPAWTWRR
jgi:lipoate-protein ligase A